MMESTSPDVEKSATFYETDVWRHRSLISYFIYDKSSISVCFPQMTFVLIFALFMCDLKTGYPSLVWHVTCPTAYLGLALYLRKKTNHGDTKSRRKPLKTPCLSDSVVNKAESQ